MRRMVLLASALALLFVPVALAGTNLGVVAGAMVPIGDFGDLADVSPYFGARWEFQDVNALGQTAVLSLLVQGGYAVLQTDSALEALLDDLRDPDDGGYFDLGLGARVYSAASPIFLSTGLSYVNLNPPGEGDTANGIGGYAGVGLVVDLPAFKLDVEGRGNFVVTDEEDNLAHFEVLASVGLPF